MYSANPLTYNQKIVPHHPRLIPKASSNHWTNRLNSSILQQTNQYSKTRFQLKHHMPFVFPDRIPLDMVLSHFYYDLYPPTLAFNLLIISLRYLVTTLESHMIIFCSFETVCAFLWVTDSWNFQCGLNLVSFGQLTSLMNPGCMLFLQWKGLEGPHAFFVWSMVNKSISYKFVKRFFPIHSSYIHIPCKSSEQYVLVIWVCQWKLPVLF